MAERGSSGSGSVSQEVRVKTSPGFASPEAFTESVGSSFKKVHAHGPWPEASVPHLWRPLHRAATRQSCWLSPEQVKRERHYFCQILLATQTDSGPV